MLGRVSRSKLPPTIQRQQYLYSYYNDLFLPWLCPSIYTAPSHSRHSTTVTREPTLTVPARSKSKVNQGIQATQRTSRRGLASAAFESYGDIPDDFIPFQGGPPRRDPTLDYSWGSTAAPLIVNDCDTTTSAAFRSFNGISGELGEIHQTLHACLQVGRFERAAALMQRLMMLYKPTAPGLLAAHNEYIRELAWRVSKDKDQELLKDLKRWFEVKLRKNRVPADATTYALMIQATLNAEDPERITRTIRRYFHFAQEDGIYDETLSTALAFVAEDEADRLQEFLPPSVLQRNGIKEANEFQSVQHGPSMTELPEVIPVPQKGLGLTALRQSLAIFSESPDTPIPQNAEDHQGHSTATQNEMRQRRLERDTYESAINRWREENAQHKKVGVDPLLNSMSLGALMWTWHEALVPLIREEVRKADEAENKYVKTSSDKDRCQYGPFLRLLTPEKISAATILTAMNLLSTEANLEEGVKIAQMVTRIGSATQDESLAETIRVEAQRRLSGSKVNFQTPALLAKNSPTLLVKNRFLRSFYRRKFKKEGRPSELIESLQWSITLQAKVGSVLFSHLIDVAKVDVVSTRADQPVVKERQPVFFHTFRYIGGKRVGIVRFNNAMFEKLSREPVKSVLSKHLPMIVEPRPWTSFRDGGFLEHALPVLRLKTADLGRRYAITASDNGDMDQTFAGLNVLGKTPWRINRHVFETMIAAWNTGTAIAKIPPLDPVVELPPEPSKTSAEYALQKLRWFQQLKSIENYKTGLRTVRCFQNFQLEVARAYIDQTFYFPHNLDFRGRAYPISPLFNHMGADNVRGLLLFAEGKELGHNGLRWLKIHLANVYGFDKASLLERENFATAHLAEIIDSVENPLGGQRWWLKAEDPWQCLATCVELKNALEAKDPAHFVSHLPVHQDGTCNGLQHYAALGGDALGAKQVNLEPGDRPSDIYTAVAELVKAEISKDAAQGDIAARALEGKITRKVVKQTVMTNVYGVTWLGAARQVRKQLDEVFGGLPNAKVNLSELAGYLATKIFSALSRMFNGAHDIQYWLGSCANRISASLSPEQIDLMLGDGSSGNKHGDFKRPPTVRRSAEGPTAFKTPVIWTNPLGMPVVQPYRKTTAKEVSSNLQTISIRATSASDPVSKRKQFQAFPPNFIHSLDACHMMLTALKCDEMGLTFAAVHDSFWTHATSVDVMNGSIRDSFIRMHSEKIIDRLAAEFSARYKQYVYFATVNASSAVGQKIKAMRKKAGRGGNLSNDKRRLEELRTERVRCKLLASDDPKQQEEGASMVTPASIFQQIADEKELLPTEELEVGIGEVPSARISRLAANEQLEVGDQSNAKFLDPATEDFDLDVENHLEDSTRKEGIETSLANDEEVKSVKSGKRKTPRPPYKLGFWMPMSFPPVPKKGDFDVSRLKSSRYFFS